MSGKLTAAQRRLLQRAYTYTYSDGSGEGTRIYDGKELAVFERLSARGLVTIGMTSDYAKSTPAGRAALLNPTGAS